MVSRLSSCHVIITHGTDTIIDTAQTLSSAHAKPGPLSDKVVVLTGAMKPQKFIDSDAGEGCIFIINHHHVSLIVTRTPLFPLWIAEFNVGMAVGSVQYLPPGVYICMHGLVLEADEAERDPVTARFMKWKNSSRKT